MSKRRVNPLAEKALALQKAMAAGGVPVRVEDREQLIAQRIQELLRVECAQLAIDQGPPKAMRTPDGGMMVQFPPAQIRVQLLQRVDPAAAPAPAPATPAVTHP